MPEGVALSIELPRIPASWACSLLLVLVLPLVFVLVLVIVLVIVLVLNAVVLVLAASDDGPEHAYETGYEDDNKYETRGR